MSATTTPVGISLNEKVNRIQDLDLDPIIVKLMDAEEGEGWSLNQAITAEKLYKRFLVLTLKHPEVSIVPSKVIDSFWHYHILDTKKYAVDCEAAFGYFLHHFPYLGMRGKQDAQALQDAFTMTKELFLSEFGESLDSASSVFAETGAGTCDGSGTGTNDCGSCGSGSTCTSSKCEPGVKERSRYDFASRPSLTVEQQLVRAHLV